MTLWALALMKFVINGHFVWKMLHRIKCAYAYGENNMSPYHANILLCIMHTLHFKMLQYYCAHGENMSTYANVFIMYYVHTLI